jgi:hypothetical protein
MLRKVKVELNEDDVDAMVAKHLGIEKEDVLSHDLLPAFGKKRRFVIYQLKIKGDE